MNKKKMRARTDIRTRNANGPREKQRGAPLFNLHPHWPGHFFPDCQLRTAAPRDSSHAIWKYEQVQRSLFQSARIEFNVVRDFTPPSHRLLHPSLSCKQFERSSSLPACRYSINTRENCVFPLNDASPKAQARS